jgi:hypothetical protein
MACNVHRNNAWPSTSIAATARNVKAPIPKIPAPDNLKRDGAAGKNARARSTYPAPLAESLAAGGPAPADWDKAKALVALLQQSGSWDGQDNIEAPLPLPAANPEPDRISIGRAIAAFTTEFEEYTALGTQRYYKLLLKQLRAFSEARGYSAIDQWTPLDVRDFRASWGVLPSTSARNMSVVKVFFEYCRLNEWMHRNPASMVRNRRGQRTDPRSEQKLPFSDEELRRMYEACDTKYGKREIQWAKATKERRAQGRHAQFKAIWTGGGHCRFHFGFGLYRLADFRRVHVSYRADAARRQHSTEDYEGTHPRLHMGS